MVKRAFKIFLLLFCNSIFGQNIIDVPQLNTAQKYILSTDYITAKTILDDYIKHHKNDKYAYYLRGMANMRLQDLSTALMDLKKVVAIDAKYDPAYNLLGYCHFISEEYALAIKYYNKAIEINDTISEYFTNRGHAYTYQHNYIFAMSDLNKAVDLDSSNYLAYNNRGYAIYYNQNIEAPSKLDLTKAESDFNKCLKLKPGFRLAYRNRGVVRYYLEYYESAYKDLKLATQWDEDDDIALHALGRTYQKLNQHTQAIETFSKCISMKNYVYIFYIDRAESYFVQKNYIAAITDLNYAINLNPSNKGEVYYKMARVYAAQNEKNKMMEYLRSSSKVKYFSSEKIQLLMQDEYFDTHKSDKDFSKFLNDLRF
jgi:tetratricopeptide (TPR) repeat protein